MYIIRNFYQFFSIFANFDKFLPNIEASLLFVPNFIQLIITYHVFFSPEYPHFIFVYVSFCFKMQIILIFYKFMPNFGPILGLPTFFLDFVQFIITYHVFFILEYSNFVLFYVFFLFQNAHNTSFLPIFDNFDKFRPNFGPSYFFSRLFLIDNNPSCLLYFRLPSFYILLCNFLFHNAHNTNFLPIFNNFDKFWANFGLIFGRPYFISNFFSTDNNLSCFLYFILPSFYILLCIFFRLKCI